MSQKLIAFMNITVCVVLAAFAVIIGRITPVQSIEAADIIYETYDEDRAFFLENDDFKPEMKKIGTGDFYLDAQTADYAVAMLEAAEKNGVKLRVITTHGNGLALDILSIYCSELSEEFSETPEFRWLAQNSWRFGFILRYPPGTLEITGITFEPWHFRYVGLDAAREITERGITLEEFLLLPSP